MTLGHMIVEASLGQPMITLHRAAVIGCQSHMKWHHMDITLHAAGKQEILGTKLSQ